MGAARAAPPAAAGESPWAVAAGEVAHILGTSLERGLSAAEVRDRRQWYGPNRLPETAPEPAGRILFAQLRTVVVALLAAAGGVALVAGEVAEGLAVLAVLVANTLLGFATELRARRSIEALQRLGQVQATVRREGLLAVVPAVELVPGDVVVVAGGDVVPADLRLAEASRLEVDESSLTGESLPVGKTADVLGGTELPVAERRNILYQGTAATRGSGTGLVLATGARTELGRIAELIEQTPSAATPFEQRLAALSRQLVAAAVGTGAVVAAVGWARGGQLPLALQSALALAVAAVPEGLPIVATVAQARAVWRMARRNALVKRLPAVETLGSTSVVLTDKTGTLTENRIRAVCLWQDEGVLEVRQVGTKTGFFHAGREILPSSDPPLRRALEVGVLCTNAELGQGGAVGDPLEVALLEMGAGAGVERPALLAAQPEVREEAFDSTAQWMATFHRRDGALRIALKGAPERVLAACTRIATARGDVPLRERETWLRRNAELAVTGLRVLALAERSASDPEQSPASDLTFLGLVGLLDPPRDDVAPAIAACGRAGIRVVMVTGDQAPTARWVGEAVGLLGPGDTVVTAGELGEDSDAARERLRAATVVARATPEQKLRVLAAHQAAGAIVAMTGDGVNDAPALERADIGIAMGRRGTQVAREAADIVLEDDRFSTLVAAVEQGRIVFDNVRTFAVYLLACNLSEILVVGVAAGAQVGLLLPLQILFLNLVTDVFPALALGAAEGTPEVLLRPPRDPRQPILGRRHWAAILGHGALLTGATLAGFGLALELGFERQPAASAAFLTLGFGQLWYVFEMRRQPSPLRNEVTRNPWVWGALVLCAALLLLAVELRPLARLLAVGPPGALGWGIALAISLAPILVLELLRGLRPGAHALAE